MAQGRSRPAEGGTAPGTPGRTLLITAGPTHEPIDAVRYIGNRSSGRLGIALAEAAAALGWRVTLLLGPTSLGCSDTRVRVERFRTVADLEGLLRRRAPECDVLVMAAAVADYRPVRAMEEGVKLRRADGGMTLELEATPDLLAAAAAARRPGQVIVGFALEPRERLLASAREKLTRKRVDAVVANPLETMDSPTIEATLVRAESEETTGGPIPKERFAGWLLERIEAMTASAT